MSNLCTRAPLFGPTTSSGHYCSVPLVGGQCPSSGTIVGYSDRIFIPINGAFDADLYGIQCQAFSNAATSIVSLQSAITSIQTQVNLLTNLSNSSSVGFTDRIADQSAVWSLFLVAAVVVLCVRGIYNLFNRSPHEGT